MDILNYLENLDKNSIFYYFIISLFIFIFLKNFFEISNHHFFSLLITIAIIAIYYQYKKKILNSDLENIEKYNKILSLKNYKHISKDLNIVILYFDLLEYGKIDKYNFKDSLINVDKLLDIYYILEQGDIYYKDKIDLAKEYHSNALNALNSINHSIKPSIGIINHKYIQSPKERELHSLIIKLKKILDQYLFQIYDLCRTNYEENPVNILSKPISLDINDPYPYLQKKDSYDLYNGFVLP
jgi:hypothetical protein